MVNHAVLIATLPKVSGFISAVCSVLVISSIVRSPRKRGLIYHRLVCGISICDFFSSVAFGLSTWPMNGNVIWSVGTPASCRAQGFFVQTGVASAIYNTALSVHFLLTIRFGWREPQMKLLEPVLHGLPGLALHLYGNATLWCWIKPDHALYRWVFFYGPLWLNILIVSLCSLMIYFHVRKIERAAAMHRYNSVRDAFHIVALMDPVERSPTVGAAKKTRRNSDENVCPGKDTVSTPPSAISRQISLGGESNDSGDSRCQKDPELHTNGRQRNSTPLAPPRRPKRDLGKTKEVAKRCFWFAASFYITWTFLSITRVLEAAKGRTYYPLVVIGTATAPLQGLPNFIIYLLPQWREIARTTSPRINTSVLSRTQELRD